MRLAGRAVGHGDPAQSADRGRSAGRGGWRGHRALCPRDPGRAAEAGNAKGVSSWEAEVGRAGGEPQAASPDYEPPFLPAGDAGAGPAAQGRGGQDQRATSGHSAGGRGHAGERRLEKELDEWRRREVSLRPDLPPCAPGPPLQRRSPSRPYSSVGRRGVQTRADLFGTWGAAAG